MSEAERLRKALARLKVMHLRTKNIPDKLALAVAVEHIESRLIDISGSGDWRDQ
jgi:hypothetical protein